MTTMAVRAGNAANGCRCSFLSSDDFKRYTGIYADNGADDYHVKIIRINEASLLTSMNSLNHGENLIIADLILYKH